MIGLGLSNAQQIKLSQLLTSNHSIRVSLSVMTLSHLRLGDITPYFLDGQVTFNFSSEITRAVNLTLFDPQFQLGLDSATPVNGGLYLDRMIGITYSVISPDNQTWFDIPVFCGPITKLKRNDDIVVLELQGKEILGLTDAWLPQTYKKNAYITTTIAQILRSLGELKTDVPNGVFNRLTRDVVISNVAKPWLVAKSLARSINYQLFYDGRGVARLRPTLQPTVWSFDDGRTGSVLTRPQVEYDLGNLVNAVRVYGATPKGKKTPLTATRIAPSTHPLSPVALGRNGVGRYMWVKEENDALTTQAQVNAQADARLLAGLNQSLNVTFDSLPIPMLEEADRVRVIAKGISVPFQITQMTLPLTIENPSTIGYLRYVAKGTRGTKGLIASQPIGKSGVAR